MPKVLQYRSKCIGCGVCQQMQPELWRMSKKDGKAVLLNAVDKKGILQLSIHECFKEAALQVANACPPHVIKVLS